ncbi:MAG TPA: bifunctional UDP-N-acetylglucosamine diphosphorylase/glucosamine-1-phosphate N-acetyltransferase GlmU [Bryobacteraceae bacterium]|nr:bifunctional UDP-N-acetylglucosamine diphosphorylase/glucosamine-1-phosphate N-acetyltransferase GlmU [Bryobacteraceae bacterium]
MNSLTVVILAAGLGTRMKSKRAKVLHRAGGLTLIEHVVNTALELTTPDHVVSVIGHQAEHVEQILAPRGIRFARQTEQKGTGHAVMVCREMIEPLGGLVMVLYGDCPLLSAATLRRLTELEQAADHAATLITTTLEDPTGYGRIVLDKVGNVQAIVEQRAATPEQLAIKLSNPGIYCFRGDLLWKHISELEPNNPAHELYLTDMVEIFRRHNHSVGTLHLEDPNQLLGINTRIELAAVDQILRERKVREVMLAGVTVEKPETVTIDSQVSIGPDTIVEPFARILGTTRIGEDCRIGAGAIVHDSELADGVDIGPYTIVGTSHLETGAHVGPFARLRMFNHVEARAHVGNFVELKKTRLGAGAKAMHLAYLGDSDIGEKVNIGAGTITCNYDGIQKHQTKIGDGAFVGSNSTLVAPIEVGGESYVGAGSVITHPVPSGSLALGRSRQVNKEGWAQRRKKKT